MPPPDALKTVIKRHWGFDDFRPLQEQAMRAVLLGRDSLVVMPTGAGKSLCFQAPAVVRGDTVVVVSPLIALMKDQVDRLRQTGIPAVALNSATPPDERAVAERAFLQGQLRLVFVSPERLAHPAFQGLIRRAPVGAFAIDEAHCISQWGHDFRPEYRQLSGLRALLPDAGVHAYTATASERVRDDIVRQLGLRSPEVLIGDFDRPNLVYRVVRRSDGTAQVREVLARHQGQAGIVYCITRKDVDELSATLRRSGVAALPYHAGLSDEQRRNAQDAFRAEQCDVIVATVAFGMGIDRSNVRFVVHRGMPKSLDHYQQEAGRAGRDGLEAECVLFWGDEDIGLWNFILDKAREKGEASPESSAIAREHLANIKKFCDGPVCRHRALVEHFGQRYAARTCGACDRCLGGFRVVPDSLTLAQKLLSGVARVKERFGPEHVARVLRADWSPEIGAQGHERLSVFGLLREHPEPVVRDWLGQLFDLGLLGVTEEGALRLNEASWAVLRGERPASLIEPPPARPGLDIDSAVLGALSEVRRQLADERRLPPDLLFSDLTLRELARAQPTVLDQMRHLHGVGDAKLRELAAPFLAALVAHRRARQARQAEKTRALRQQQDAHLEQTQERGKQLLRAVLEAPDEDSPRLAYAGWLEEQGDTSGVARAELIRLQCGRAAEKAPLPQPPPRSGEGSRKADEERRAEFFSSKIKLPLSASGRGAGGRG